MKLDNLMMNSQNPKDLKVKIIDFGFATKFEKEQGMTFSLGSPLYTAPEIICGKTYDERVDVWALGVIAYSLIEGRSPFNASSLEQAQSLTLNKKINFS